MPDAAGLVLASDQDDARAYAKIVKRVTGQTPALILSDDPKASKKIAQFAASDKRFAVCVRMISEGVDVPRAACLAWMTSYRDAAVLRPGRRARRAGPDAGGVGDGVPARACRPLLTLAAEMETDRNHVMPPPKSAGEGDELDLPPREPSEAETVDQWQALGADAEFAHVLSDGRAVTATPLTGEDVGLPRACRGLLTPEQTASLLARRDEEHRRRASTAVDEDEPDDRAPVEVDRAWEQAGALRREVNSLVGQLAARTGAPHGVLHGRLRKAVPGPPSAAASAEVLASRRDWLLEQLVRGALSRLVDVLHDAADGAERRRPTRPMTPPTMASGRLCSTKAKPRTIAATLMSTTTIHEVVLWPGPPATDELFAIEVSPRSAMVVPPAGTGGDAPV